MVVAGNICFALARRFARTADWRSLSRYTDGTAVVVLVVLLVQSVFNPQGLAGPASPLAGWAGLIQRTSILIVTLWVLTASVRLLRLPRAWPGTSPAPR